MHGPPKRMGCTVIRINTLHSGVLNEEGKIPVSINLSLRYSSCSLLFAFGTHIISIVFGMGRGHELNKRGRKAVGGAAWPCALYSLSCVYLC